MTRRISSSTIWELLALLADGKFHSGEILAHELGISRASVFNLLTKAAETGVDLNRVRGRGYRLGRPWQRLDAGRVSALLGEQAQQFDIEILDQAASSNSLLMQRCRDSNETNGMRSGTVLAVELQTAGRGRFGRVWQSGLGNSLTFSVLWKFESGLNSLSGLSLAVGVSLMRTLTRQGADDVYLKWPNDLVTNRGKLGGVLVEAQGDVLGPCNVVIGIGINCSVPARLRAMVDQPICGLDEVSVEVPDRNHLLAVLLGDLADVLREFQRGGFAVLRGEWQRYHMHENRRVSLRLPSGKVESGVARGTNETGELCLEGTQGIRWFNAGEIGTTLI
jgi:BirA family biotin operon repressor/biotin-[acetyl-CoA-carboxylase] ligase